MSPAPAPTEQLLPLLPPGLPSQPRSLTTVPPQTPSLSQKIEARARSKDKFFSLEFFPPRTKPGAVNLVSRLERLRAGAPLFVDITWHPAGNPAGDTETSSMMIAQVAANYLGLETMLHMTCVGASKEDISGHLEKAGRLGLRNILALRGDLPDVSQDWQHDPEKFNFGTDLVRHIRNTTAQQFSLCVAGYPSGHPEAASYQEDLLHLKEKVEAGADFIITQLFFSANTFKQFVDDCRALGIQCPIIPGILPIQTFDSLRHIVKLSKLEVPEEISSIVTPLKGNDEAIRNFGIHQASEMIRDLFNTGYAPGVHFYTLNKEVATIAILKSVGLWSQVERSLPWRQSANPGRAGEGVRPVFWRHRARAYIHHTRHCSSFPSTAWDQSLLPALSAHKPQDEEEFFLASQSSRAELLSMWGSQPVSEMEVRTVFSSYYSGGATRLPWVDTQHAQESEEDQRGLERFSQEGFLIINFLPAISCLDSGDPGQGWGSQPGYVFQKAYLEFFTSEENITALSETVQTFPGVTFQAVTRAGLEKTNIALRQPAALTWGVFNDREVVQPTVLDPDTFRVWAREAFSLWQSRWAALYDESSQSRTFLKEFADQQYLVYLVDNDFPRGNRLWKLLEESLEKKKSGEKRF